MASDSPLVLEFAGLSFALATKSEGIRTHIEKRYGAFRAEEKPRSHLLEIVPDSSLDQSDPNSISIELDGDALTAGSSSLSLEFEFGNAGGEGMLRIASGQLFIDIENSLRVLIAHSVTRRGMLLIHAAAFSRPDGRTVDLFAGYSGAGKSTVSRLAAEAGRAVLSDDIVLAEAADNNVKAVSTPLGSLEGPEPKPADAADVSALYFLEHGEKNAVTNLDPAAALVRLASVVPFTPSAGTRAFQNVLEAAARIVERVESAVFSFVPDETAVAFLEEHER